jgi:hypothetical protein
MTSAFRWWAGVLLTLGALPLAAQAKLRVTLPDLQVIDFTPEDLSAMAVDSVQAPPPNWGELQTYRAARQAIALDVVDAAPGRHAPRDGASTLSGGGQEP